MRQSSSAPLLSALASPAVRSALPQPVLLAAEQLGALQLPLAAGGIGGAALRNAILSSGIFREAMLASGTSPSPQGDVKSALLALRQSLVSWIGKQQPAAVVAVAAPPVRGAPPRARAADIPPIDPTSPPDEVGRQVLERTESSLARIRLQQHSSLPDSLASGKAEWNLELPVLIGLHQTSMQIQITRDQENSVPADQERGWQLRFAINLPTLGEVGAQVSLHGGATGVMLWAAEDETRQLMEQEMESLREQLQAAGLQPGSIILRQGVPTSPPLPSGHLLDSVS
ncbi:MAG TPA: flagellar hook-length control protein FliK [Devosia sp.]|nr:flagellar hook-length control protein FliK [Devosia sp.]